MAGGGGRGRWENPKGVVFSVRAAVNLYFSCVNPEIKTLKLVIKVNRVEQFSTAELFLMC